MLARTRVGLLGIALLLGGTGTGCDRLKSMGKGDADGAAPASGGGGGGILSFLSGDFEGEITERMTSKKSSKGPSDVVFGIKKPKYRIDTAGPVGDAPQLAGGGSFIIDPPAKKGYVLVHPQKMAIVIDFEKAKSLQGKPGMPGAPGKPGVPATPPKIEKTAKKEVIAGYTCDIWNITTEKNRAEVCVAEGITWFDLGDLGWSSPEFAAAAALKDANHFPLRVISYDASGIEEMRMEATKVDKKKLDDTRFAVPADYRQVDMSAMLGGMGMPGGMPSGGVPPHHR